MTRALLGTAAVLVFLAGLQLFVFPLRTADWFAWTIDAPMTAVFLGASYWSSAVLEAAGARTRDRARASLSVWPVLVFTVLTLVVTLVHLDLFHLGSGHPSSARVVTWGWLAVYAVVPLLMVAVLLLEARRQPPAASPAPAGPRLPAALRALLVLLAVVMVGTGVALLLAPAAVAEAWPWPLTPLTGRAVGAWLVGLGWAAGQAARVRGARAASSVGLTGVAFVALQLVALVRYGDALAWAAPGAATYVGGLVALGVAGGWILAAGRRTRP